MFGTERKGDKEGEVIQTERQWMDRAVMVREPLQREKASSMAFGRAGDVVPGQVQTAAG